MMSMAGGAAVPRRSKPEDAASHITVSVDLLLHIGIHGSQVVVVIVVDILSLFPGLWW